MGNGRIARWEWALAGMAVALALVLGGANLGEPSLWHDEAVQVLVAKNIAETGRAVLPSGKPHPIAPAFNAVVAASIELFGDSEAAARAPSVFFNSCNVLLTFLVVRLLLGRGAGLMAAFAMALSPWTVAWAREARFYTMQQTCYLLFVGALWRAQESGVGRRELGVRSQESGVGSRESVSCLSSFIKEAQGLRASIHPSSFPVVWWILAACAAYILGLAVSLHSLLFLCPAGLFGLAMLAWERKLWSRWTVVVAVSGLLGAGTLAFYALKLPAHDASVVFTAASVEAHVYDPAQGHALYYVRWLWDNLGRGFFLLAVIGTALMILRDGRRGVYTALAFWGPLIVMSLALAYRRHRFLYFAFPFYTAAFCYAVAAIVPWICGKFGDRHLISPRQGNRRRQWSTEGNKVSVPEFLAAALMALFLARVAWSGVLLTTDSIDVARGADTTLATRHPQFRKPCLYVRDRLTPDTVVVADTYVVALYYIGRVDNWFPSARLPSERWEIGTEGLKTIEDLQAYMAAHPKGYFIAEWYRFGFFPEQEPDRAWVRQHMTRIDEACTGDVTLYAWGLPAPDAGFPAIPLSTI